MDAKVKFKKGDKVRRKDGKKFINGADYLTVDAVRESATYGPSVWFSETKSWANPDHLEHYTGPTQSYPDDNPKTAVGLTKPALSCVPPLAIFQLGQAMKDGERKYGRMNWREKTVTASVYYDAALRHLMAWYDGEQTASDSGVHHLSHAMACMAIVIDAEANGKLNDDRPTAGALPSWLSAQTQKV